MPEPSVKAAGGWAALRYSLRKARDAGGLVALYRRLRSRNACKTCAFGMGGQRGGMVNEAGRFPEVCKKSIQAQAGDMQEPIDPSFFADHSLEELERWDSMQMEYAGRLTVPVASDPGDTHMRPISWEEGLDRLARALQATSPERSFFYASGRSSNEAAFLMQTLARSYGTANIHNCSCYCHQASGVALSRMIGSGTATVRLEDLDLADLAIVAGANPASNHPRLIVKLVEIRRRGGTVIVVNPLRELGLTRFKIPSQARSMVFGSQVSDIYLQPNVGSDIAVFKAMLKGVLERDAADRVFLRNHVEGWEAVEADVAASDWGELIQHCGLGRQEIDQAVDAICRAKNGMTLWAMGLTHHEHGTDNIHALANVAIARGWVGRPGAGFMPIRGHSNVQGVGSVGFTPELKDAFAKKMEEAYGIPSAGGLDTYASMIAAEEGKIDAAVLLGGNLWGSNPDSEWAGKALRNIGTIAHVTTKLNPGHVHGRGKQNLIFPVLARDEEAQATTQESMFNFVRLSDGGFSAPGEEVRSEVELVCGLAARLLPDAPFPFDRMTDHAAVRDAIAKVVPGYAAIGEVDATRKEFQIAGRVFHQPSFKTDSGRLRMRVPPLPADEVPEGGFRLMTLRSEGQFNTVVYEQEDLYRGVNRRDVVMIGRWDGERLGLGEFDPVVVESEIGRMEVVVVFVDLPPGNAAMYYPEANVLVPRRIDPSSGTPAFKSVPIRIVT